MQSPADAVARSAWLVPPVDGVDVAARHLRHAAAVHRVALQVEFERQILKPVFHLIGFRLWV